MIFHVTLERAEDGWIVAECPALPGCISQGRDEEDALENIKEAITAWLWAEDQKATEALTKKAWLAARGCGGIAIWVDWGISQARMRSKPSNRLIGKQSARWEATW